MENLRRFLTQVAAFSLVGMVLLVLLALAGWGVLLFVQGHGYWTMVAISGTALVVLAALIVSYIRIKQA